MGGANARNAGRTWLSDLALDCMGLRADAGRTQAHGRCRSCSVRATITKAHLDFCCARWSRALHRFVFCWSLHQPREDASTERGGYNCNTAKIDRGVAVRKPE